VHENLLLFGFIFRFTHLLSGRLGEERNVTALPIVDYGPADVVDVSLSTLLQLSSTLGHLVDEVFCICPGMHPENVCDVLRINAIKDGLNVGLRVWKAL